MIIRNAQVFVEDHFEKKDLYVQGDRLVEAAPAGDTEVLDLNGKWVLPGFTDVHFHGAVSADLCDGEAESLKKIARYEASVGVTQICPATMTVSHEQLDQVYKMAGAYENTGDGADFVGIHMEGPYISPDKLGAQNPAYVVQATKAEFEHFQSLCKGLIKIISIAPEQPGNLDFIAEVSDQVICSIAHCTADYDVAKAALDKGARHVTHLFNAMPPLHHRKPGVIGAAFDDKKTHVELICDGVHLHPAVIRIAFELFKDRVVLISDSMRACGLADGEYDLGGQAVHVHGRKATLADGTIAGSATNLADCVRFAIRSGIPAETAFKAATLTPATEIGIADEVGVLLPGRRANFQVWNPESLALEGVYVHGRRYQA